MTDRFPTVAEMVAAERPARPVICLHPHTIAASAAAFRAAIPGTAMYAVKCNPHPVVLTALAAGGIGMFDVASKPEWQAVSRYVPGAVCHYMHPVKPIEWIEEAYKGAGIRTFAFDHGDELAKIDSVAGGDPEVQLMVRLATDQSGAVWGLGEKFGVEPASAVQLIRDASERGYTVGVAFHVGSQCRVPSAFDSGLRAVGEVIAQLGTPVDAVDVGGGFPAAYPGQPVPPLGDYGDAIWAAWDALGLPAGTALLSEPGRALVADGMSMLLRVELRRGQALYLNDGRYGTLFELGSGETNMPVRAHRSGGTFTRQSGSFKLFGPTCDSLDEFPGPFGLPADIAAGDWVEIGAAGAYSLSLRTEFNGFYASDTCIIEEAPWYR